MKLASPKQKTFILDLLSRTEPVRNTLSHAEQYTVEMAWKTMRIAECPEERQITSQEASSYIDFLLGVAPAKQFATATPAQTAYPEVDKGRYGVTDGSALRFFRVTRTRDKKWTRVHEVKDVTNSGRPRHIYVGDRNEKRRILELIIAQGPVECMKLYGQHLGACGRCNSTLTDDVSRHVGLGPHCRMLLGVKLSKAEIEAAHLAAATKEVH